MTTDDTLFLLQNGIWVSCLPVKGKWEMTVYEKQKARWLKKKKKSFNHPAVAYNWVQIYILRSYPELAKIL